MAKRSGKKQKGAHKEVNRPPAIWDRILVYSVAFTVFAIPLFIWPGITEYGYGKSIVGLIAISILSILWGISAWQKKGWSIRIPWIIFPVLGFVVASLFSLVGALNGRVVVQSLVLFVFFFQLLLIIANTVREKRDVNLILFSLLASGFLAGLYGLLQYLGVMRGASIGGSGLGNVISTMGNRNYLGGFLAYTLFPAVVLVVRLRSRLLRATSILLISFSFGTVLLLEQMGTVISLIIAAITLIVGWLIFRPVEPLRRNRGWLIGLGLALVLTFLIEAPSGPLNSVVGLSADGSSWIGRIWAASSGKTRSWDWWVGWEMFKDHPLTGVGLGNYKLNFIPYKAKFLATPRGASYDFYIPRAAQAHNEYVQAIAELGILGILALISFLVVIPISVWRRLRRNRDEADRFDILLYAAGIVAFLVHALVSFPAHLPASSLAVLVIGGLLFSRAYGEEATVPVRLTGWGMKSAIAAVTAIGLSASVIAARDLEANFLMGKGIEQLQLGQYSTAEQTLKRSIRLDFAPRQTYYYLASAQARLGEYDEALANYKRCFTRFVDESVYLIYADLATSRGRTEEARAAVELLLASHPDREIETKARYIEANIALKENDYNGAIDILEELVSDNPNFELAYIGLGNIFLARGMPVNARDSFEKGLAIVEKRLAAAEKRLSEATRMTTEQYGQIRQTIESLRKERDYINSQLEKLPTPETNPSP